MRYIGFSFHFLKFQKYCIVLFSSVGNIYSTKNTYQHFRSYFPSKIWFDKPLNFFFGKSCDFWKDPKINFALNGMWIVGDDLQPSWRNLRRNRMCAIPTIYHATENVQPKSKFLYDKKTVSEDYSHWMQFLELTQQKFNLQKKQLFYTKAKTFSLTSHIQIHTLHKTFFGE